MILPQMSRDSYCKRIDGGLTGDKIPATDLATVPVTTDDEAAAQPTPDEALARDFATFHDMACRAGVLCNGTHPNSGLHAPPSNVPWIVVSTAVTLGTIAIVIAALQLE